MNRLFCVPLFISYRIMNYLNEIKQKSTTKAKPNKFFRKIATKKKQNNLKKVFQNLNMNKAPTTCLGLVESTAGCV